MRCCEYGPLSILSLVRHLAVRQEAALSGAHFGVIHLGIKKVANLTANVRQGCKGQSGLQQRRKKTFKILTPRALFKIPYERLTAGYLNFSDLT